MLKRETNAFDQNSNMTFLRNEFSEIFEDIFYDDLIYRDDSYNDVIYWDNSYLWSKEELKTKA